MNKIPNIIHFVYGLSPTFGWGEYERMDRQRNIMVRSPKADAFDILKYLAIKSAYDVNKPDKIYFWHQYEPYGEWWDKAKPYLTMMHVEAPTEIFGNPVANYAHQADVIRLQALIEYGGIYADLDTLFRKPFTEFLIDAPFVMGGQGINAQEGLCNALMMSEPDSEFAKIWLAQYTSFNDDEWTTHSVQLPPKIAAQYPELIKILPYKTFFWPLYHRDHMHWFYREIITDDDKLVSNMGGLLHANDKLEEAYSHHLWMGKSATREYVKDYPHNSMEDWMTEECIRTVDTNFNIKARKFL
jgi:hypothetical protein